MDDEQITEPTVAPLIEATEIRTLETVNPPIVIKEPIIDDLTPEPAMSHSISEGSPISVVETYVAPIPDSATPEPLTTHPSPITATDISAPPPVINTQDLIVTEPEPRSEATKPRSSSEELTTGAQSTQDPIPVPLPVVPELSLPLSSSPERTTGDPSPISETFDVALLTDDQLKAAAALYTKRNQAEISRKGVAKRKETMELNQREIIDFLSRNNGSPLPRIAKHTNITLGTTSKYLRQLNASGKVRAEGWGKTRRYYLR